MGRAPRHLAIIGPVGPRLSRGIADGMQLHGRWRIDLHHLHARWTKHLRRHPPTALLVYGGDRRLFDQLAWFTGPLINYSGRLQRSPCPRIQADNRAIGAWAARHFLERGFESQAACGYGQAAYSDERLQGFADELATVGCRPHRHLIPGVPTPRADFADDLCRWLRELPRPCAIFAANDDLARELCEAALTEGRRVPEDVAILGVDDSPSCQLAPVPLSSIVLPQRDIGRACIAALGRALAGEELPAETRLPPNFLHTRQSSELPAIGDGRVAQAVAWIRNHLNESFLIDELARALAMGRRTLEQAFADELGRSPRKEVERQRMALARRLLRNAALKIEVIAKRCGYRDRHRFTTVFTRVVGCAPGEWRERHRAGA